MYKFKSNEYYQLETEAEELIDKIISDLPALESRNLLDDIQATIEDLLEEGVTQ